MSDTVQRYRFFVDPMVPCYCELEPSPVGEYVLFSDYERDIALERGRKEWCFEHHPYLIGEGPTIVEHVVNMCFWEGKDRHHIRVTDGPKPTPDEINAAIDKARAVAMISANTSTSAAQKQERFFCHSLKK